MEWNDEGPGDPAEEFAPVYDVPAAFDEAVVEPWSTPKMVAEMALAGMEDGDLRMLLVMLAGEAVSRHIVKDVCFLETCECEGMTLIDPVGLSEHHDPDCLYHQIDRPEYTHLQSDTTRTLVGREDAPDGD